MSNGYFRVFILFLLVCFVGAGFYLSRNAIKKLELPNVFIFNNEIRRSFDVNVVMDGKVEGLNYDLIGQIRKNDVNGRSVIYSKRPGSENIGGQFVFLKWEDINKSGDKYAVFKMIASLSDEELVFEKIDYSPFVKGRVVFGKDGGFPSELFVDNLSLGYRNYEFLGNILDLIQDSDDYLQPGDVVNFGFREHESTHVIDYDEFGIPLVQWIEIRRFN